MPQVRRGIGTVQLETQRVLAGGAMFPLWQEPVRTLLGRVLEAILVWPTGPRDKSATAPTYAGNLTGSGARGRRLRHPDHPGLDLAAQPVPGLLVDPLVARTAGS